jgi:hypothetical protein
LNVRISLSRFLSLSVAAASVVAGAAWSLSPAAAHAEDGPIYAQLSSTASQQPKDTSPAVATLNSNDSLQGIGHTTDGKNTDIVIKTAGVYFVVAAAQVGKEKGDGDEFVNLWMRQNGKDIDNSNTRQHIKDPKFTTVLVCQGICECKAGDTLQVVFSASSGDKGVGIIASSPKGEPVIPSLIVSVYRIR